MPGQAAGSCLQKQVASLTEYRVRYGPSRYLPNGLGTPGVSP